MPGRHQAARRPVGDPHDAGDHLAFGAVHGARAFGLGDDQANLLVADPARLASGLPEQGQHQLARPVEHPDQRGGDAGDDPHHRGHARGDLFRRAQGDLLGHQFADDQRQIGDRHHHRPDTDRLREGGRHAGLDQACGEARTQRRAGEGARKDADQRDADLHAGQEAAGILGQPDGRRGPLAALVGQQLQPRGAGRDDGQFGHRQKAVDQRQQNDDRNLEVHGLQLSPDVPAIVLDGHVYSGAPGGHGPRKAQVSVPLDEEGPHNDTLQIHVGQEITGVETDLKP